MPVGEGSLWDELMGFVDPEPTAPEPTLSSQSIKAGVLKDDGSYEQLGTRRSRVDQSLSPPPFIQQYIQDQIEDQVRQEQARTVLESVGFVIVEEGETSMFEAMGGIVQSDDPIQAILRDL